MKSLIFFFGIILTTSSAFSAGKCEELKSELAAMQKAQQQIIMSLVGNHEAFASSLEEYSEILDSKQSPKALTQSMNKSAAAFRTRGVQGKKMAQQLGKATEDLMARVAACL